MAWGMQLGRVEGKMYNERTVIDVREMPDDYTHEVTYRYKLTCGHVRTSVVKVECGDLVSCCKCPDTRK